MTKTVTSIPPATGSAFRVKYGELLSLAQMRVQIATGLNEWVNPESVAPKAGTDLLGHLINHLDIIPQALKSIQATLDEIRERTLGETSE